MKKTPKTKTDSPKIDPYLEGLMAKLLEHLVILERKMDTVLSALGSKPASSSYDQAKPFQKFESSQPAPRRDRVLYEAVCADCSKVCEVPFKPSEDRPVFCKECFGRRKAGGDGPKLHVHHKPSTVPQKVLEQISVPKITPPPAEDSSKKKKKSKPSKKSKR